MDEQRQNEDRLHSVKSAAAFLGGVAESTVRVWLWQGRLTRIKIGRLVRIRESELLKMINPVTKKRKPMKRSV
jgi:excisionase family DNA binding protein